MQIKIAAAQYPCSLDQAANEQCARRQIEAAAQQGADLLLLPELCVWPYFCLSEDVRHFDRAQTIPGPLTHTLSQAARRHEMILITSLFERRASGLYHNTAVVFERDGSLAGTYRKMHIPQEPGFSEKFYFTPGEQGFVPIQTSAGRLGVLICWDQWFPEAARLMALADAELLLYPSAIGWNPQDSEGERARQLAAWLTVQRGHAIANSLPVVGSNRTGTEGSPVPGAARIQFWGNSFISTGQGEIIARAADTGAQLIVADIDLSANETTRRNWPFFRDRRIEHYQGLTRRHQNPDSGTRQGGYAGADVTTPGQRRPEEAGGS